MDETRLDGAADLTTAERRGVAGWTTLLVSAGLGLLLGLLELGDGDPALVVTVVVVFSGLVGVALIVTARVDELREELRRGHRP